MTDFTKARIDLALTAAAEHIADELDSGSKVRLLRAMAIDMIAALTDFGDTPAATRIDDAVRGEIINRSTTNTTLRNRLDRYAFHIEDLGDVNFEDPS